MIVEDEQRIVHKQFMTQFLLRSGLLSYKDVMISIINQNMSDEDLEKFKDMFTKQVSSHINTFRTPIIEDTNK